MAERNVRAMSAPEVSAFYEGARKTASFSTHGDGVRMVMQALESLQDESEHFLTNDGKDELASITMRLMSEYSL